MHGGYRSQTTTDQGSDDANALRNSTFLATLYFEPFQRREREKKQFAPVLADLEPQLGLVQRAHEAIVCGTFEGVGSYSLTNDDRRYVLRYYLGRHTADEARH
ncbi:MAG: hypothetical protein IIB36_10530 [Gemmatimonadetes bacterium]|nr:hypothetical protein [Gemmatimonadota bacterium]